MCTHCLISWCLFRLDRRNWGISIENLGRRPLKVEGNVLEALVGEALKRPPGVC